MVFFDKYEGLVFLCFRGDYYRFNRVGMMLRLGRRDLGEVVYLVGWG